ncbi:MAG: hypothetical protein ACOZE7_04670 [Pseudomonadota bacterium]
MSESQTVTLVIISLFVLALCISLWMLGKRGWVVDGVRNSPRIATGPTSPYRVIHGDHGSLVDLGLLQLLERSQGGVHKRISEVREVAEAIRLRHPELFKDEFGLTYWLSATDDFLCGLRDAAWPEGTSPSHDELRRRFERHQPRPDYEALR